MLFCVKSFQNCPPNGPFKADPIRARVLLSNLSNYYTKWSWVICPFKHTVVIGQEVTLRKR